MAKVVFDRKDTFTGTPDCFATGSIIELAASRKDESRNAYLVVRNRDVPNCPMLVNLHDGSFIYTGERLSRKQFKLTGTIVLSNSDVPILWEADGEADDPEEDDSDETKYDKYD